MSKSGVLILAVFCAVAVVAGWRGVKRLMATGSVSPQNVADSVEVVYPSWWPQKDELRTQHPEVVITDTKYGRLYRNESGQLTFTEGPPPIAPRFCESDLSINDYTELLFKAKVTAVRPSNAELPATVDAVLYRYGPDGVLLSCTPVLFELESSTATEAVYMLQTPILLMHQPEFVGTRNGINFVLAYIGDTVSLRPPGY